MLTAADRRQLNSIQLGSNAARWKSQSGVAAESCNSETASNDHTAKRQASLKPALHYMAWSKLVNKKQNQSQRHFITDRGVKMEMGSRDGRALFKRENNQWTMWKKYTSGPRYWNVPVLVDTETFLVYQYCLKMWYLRSLERAGVIQKLTILESKNGLVLSNTRVPVSGTWSILFPTRWLTLWQSITGRKKGRQKR